MTTPFEKKVRQAIAYLKIVKINSRLVKTDSNERWRIKCMLQPRVWRREDFNMMGPHTMVSDIYAVGLGFDPIGGTQGSNFVKAELIND